MDQPTHRAHGDASNIMQAPQQECSLPQSAPAHAQLAELASTIDPSHIIHLIRQLLPLRTAKPDRSASEHTLSDGHGEAEETQEELDAQCKGPTDAEEEDREEEGESGKRQTPRDEAGRSMDSNGVPQRAGDVRGLQAMDSCSGEGLSTSDIRQGNMAAESSVEERGKESVCGEEELREEAGCVLWDLAASESQADFLVDNHIFDVLQAILCLPQSDRMREICLGILGNLACHSKPEKAMVTVEGLVQTVILQLQFDDPPSLSEACRLLSAGLHSDAASAWVVALKVEEVLERIMWVAANTMNPQLREKSTELLLAMVDSRRESVTTLLPRLMRLGLPELLTDLAECEVAAINEGTSSCGDAVLDIVLQIAEAISLSDEFAALLAANRKLFSLACQVICLSYKDEIGPSVITGIVLVANLLTEESNLIRESLEDEKLVGHLLNLLPRVSDDPGARNALWSILDRLCQHFLAAREHKPPPSIRERTGLVTALADGSNLLMDDLDDHPDEDLREDSSAGDDAVAAPSCGRQLKLTTVGNIVRVMEEWLAASARSGDADDLHLERPVLVASKLLGNYLASPPDSVMDEQVLGR